MANNKEKYQQIVNSEIYLTRILDNVVTGPQKESCWTLTNKKSIFWFNGTSIRAQIFFYYHSAPNKEIPIGYQVSAKCNNPYCINPNHLELLTRSAIRKKLINSGWQHSKATKQKMSKSHKRSYVEGMEFSRQSNALQIRFCWICSEHSK